MGQPALDRKAQAQTLDDQLRDLSRKQAISDLDIGGLLKTIRDDELWAELGAASFEVYCSTVAGLGLKRVNSRIRLFEAYQRFDLKPNELIPSTKLRILLPVVTKTNVRTWLKRAADMSCAELVATVREEREKLRKAGKAPRPRAGEPQVKNMGIGFTTTQLKTVRRGLDYAKAHLKAKTNGEAIAILVERALPKK